MIFMHRFRVKAAVEDVAEFHRGSASMAAITPPPIIVRVHSAPDKLKSGDRMDFTLWAGPIPVRWTACIEDASEEGFTDRQLSGPSGSWVHRHGVRGIGDDLWLVGDSIFPRQSILATALGGIRVATAVKGSFAREKASRHAHGPWYNNAQFHKGGTQ